MHRIRVYVDTMTMKTRDKVFDCVRMKQDAQRRLQEEYTQRRDEFSSYVDFLNRKVEETPLWKNLQKSSHG